MELGTPAQVGNRMNEPEIIPFARRKDLITTALVLAEQAIKQHEDLTPAEAQVICNTFNMAMPNRW